MIDLGFAIGAVSDFRTEFNDLRCMIVSEMWDTNADILPVVATLDALHTTLTTLATQLDALRRQTIDLYDEAMSNEFDWDVLL